MIAFHSENVLGFKQHLMACKLKFLRDAPYSSKNSFKLSCDRRFQRAFTTCVCIFKVITLVVSNQRYYFENANACSKRTLKTTVATQLYPLNLFLC